MSRIPSERQIEAGILVTAPAGRVWEAWTTEAGARTFFAPECRIELRPGGPYEMYFVPNAEPGRRGGEGNVVLAIQPERMLGFTWNAPPSLPAVRPQRTHVVVRLAPTGDGTTQVALRHGGWGDGGAWDQAFEYFARAWEQIVLPRLEYRFRVGPVDWTDPPR